MKARLLRDNGTIQLLLCNGVIKIVDFDEAKHFLINFDSPIYYSAPGEWDNDIISMEEYKGETIATVDENNVLHVFNSKLFRGILSLESTKYLTVPEYAALHGKKTAIVRRFCLDGRLKGAIQKGTRWLIPEDCPYPTSE